jgi:hypothetical protein
MNPAKSIAYLAVMVFVLAPSAVLGQASLDPGQLPKSTTFYLAWHGTPAGEARKANSLLAMWDDVDFAPVRNAIAEQLMRNSADSQKDKAALTADELSQYAALLDNEFVFGYIGNPNPPAKMSPAAAHEPQKNVWNGMFFAYDHTGKEATLAKLLLQARLNEKDPPKVSSATIAGISVVKAERKNDTSYWADDGKYSFSASEPAVLEQISGWLKHATPDAAGLSQSAAYREADDLLKGGLAEFFFRFPSIRNMSWDSSVMGFRLRPLVQSLKLEAVHSIAGRLVLEGARTRVQGAILGEANPGSLFDIWDQGSPSPASWRFITSNTVSYQQSRVNLAGIYGLVKGALQATSGASQRNPLEFLETAFTTRMGMPVPAALALFTGEFAALQSSPTLDPAKRVYVIGIRKKAATLTLLHVGLSERVSGERSEGDTTFLKISEGGIASAAGTASWKYYHLAMTPELMVAAGRSESVREALAAGKGTSGENPSVPHAWQQAREAFPKTVNGLGFFDFQKIDWTLAKERWLAESHKAPTSAGTGRAPAADAFAKAMRDLDPRVFPRHLHLTASASWKDAHGMHFDGWID